MLPAPAGVRVCVCVREVRVREVRVGDAEGRPSVVGGLKNEGEGEVGEEEEDIIGDLTAPKSKPINKAFLVIYYF